MQTDSSKAFKRGNGAVHWYLLRSGLESCLIVRMIPLPNIAGLQRNHPPSSYQDLLLLTGISPTAPTPSNDLVESLRGF